MPPTRILVLVSILLPLLWAAATQAADEAIRRVPPQFIASDSVRALQREGRPPLLVDVRTREEFEATHITGAVNIPLRELSHRAVEIPRSGLVVLY